MLHCCNKLIVDENINSNDLMITAIDTSLVFTVGELKSDDLISVLISVN